MRNLIPLFCVTMVLFVFFFLKPHYGNIIVLLISACTFFMFVYAIVKIKKLNIMTEYYKIERQRRIQLEEELQKEIDLSNRILRDKSTPLSSPSPQPSGQ